MNKKKSHFIGIRVNDDLFQKLTEEAKRAGISQSEYIRQKLENGRTVVHQEIIAEVPMLKKLIAEFGKIGSNINQIAHYFNGGGIYSPEMADRLDRALSQLYMMKFEVEKMGGAFRGYANANRQSYR